MSYSSTELQQYARITGRQMDHWYRRGWLISFDRRPNDGSGVPIEWTERTVRKALIMSCLVRAGFVPERAHDLSQRYLNRSTTADDVYVTSAGIGVVVRISLKEMMKPL